MNTWRRATMREAIEFMATRTIDRKMTIGERPPGCGQPEGWVFTDGTIVAVKSSASQGGYQFAGIDLWPPDWWICEPSAVMCG
jgi:hypothetical protein